jgi:multicomponent Na+:H+ antiporter subunit F
MRKIWGEKMDRFFLWLGMGLFTLVLLCLYRVSFGPGVLNRIAGICAIGTKALVILLLMGFIYNRVEMFIDISMVYALLNFIGTITAAKYLEMKGEV